MQNIRQSIVSEIMAHPKCGDPIAVYDIYVKYRIFLSYQSFRELIAKSGIISPVSYKKFKPHPTPVRITKLEQAEQFITLNRNFTWSSLRSYLASRGASPVASPNGVLAKLVEAGQIRRVSLGVYESLVYGQKIAA